MAVRGLCSSDVLVQAPSAVPLNRDHVRNYDGRPWFGIAMAVRWLWNVDPVTGRTGIVVVVAGLWIPFAGCVNLCLGEISLAAGLGLGGFRTW
jgi:hypothetical protein